MTAGSSVFLSYARADRVRVEQLAAALEGHGFDLWWDARITGGAAFAKSIEAALENSDAVVVAWSAASVNSDWVRDEAGHGRDRGRLVPISLDGSAPPLGFRQYHAINFSSWRGKAGAVEVQQLLAAIAAMASHEAQVQTSALPATRSASPWLARRKVLIGSGAAAVVLGGAAGWRWLAGSHAPDNSIAVLPFANLSGDAGQAYFSDGLAEELRTRLGADGQFKVAAQTSSDQFRERAGDVVTIGRKLGVALLLEGSVRRAGDAVRVSAELIEARTGLSKWAQSFDRQMKDIFAVQSEIASTVTQAIVGQVSAAAARLLASAGTSVVAAYDAYLKGRAFYADDSGEDSERKALASFDAAIAADPHFAQAHAMRAETLLDIATAYTKASQIPAVFADARASAQRATALAPKLAMAQMAMGNVVLNAHIDFRAAQPWFDRALALAPNDAKTLGKFAYFALRQGRFAEALAAIDKALDLDRLNPFAFLAKARVLYYARQYPQVIDPARQALALNPHLAIAHATIGFAMLGQGKWADARSAFAAEPHEQFALTGLGIANWRLHDLPRARDALSRLQTKFGDTVLYQQGIIAAQWGEVDRAIEILTKGKSIDSGLTWAKVEPLLDVLHGKPGFAALLSSMGLA